MMVKVEVESEELTGMGYRNYCWVDTCIENKYEWRVGMTLSQGLPSQ
jgi:hypothetical protein